MSKRKYISIIVESLGISIHVILAPGFSVKLDTVEALASPSSDLGLERPLKLGNPILCVFSVPKLPKVSAAATTINQINKKSMRIGIRILLPHQFYLHGKKSFSLLLQILQCNPVNSDYYVWNYKNYSLFCIISKELCDLQIERAAINLPNGFCIFLNFTFS